MIKVSITSFTVAAMLCTNLCLAQVSDIGISFTKHGFIQKTSIEQGYLVVNFIEEDGITTEKLFVNKKPEITIDGASAATNQLVSGMELNVNGEFFQTTKSSIAHKIAVTTKKGLEAKINMGRIDAIKGNYAFVDGNKIKLENDVKVTGASNSGYQGKVFNQLTDLKPGDFINIEGSYGAKYLYCDRVTVEPETETQEDKKALHALGRFHDRYFTTWVDPAKRSELFGMEYPGEGRILNNAAIQEYVNKLGISLVPAHIQNKLHCMFIVTDSLEWNASMRANGVCIVHLGLLLGIQNEAQLAAVLGHEIAHAIYEHTAQEWAGAEAAEARAEKREKTAGVVRGIFNKVKPKVVVRNNKGRVIYAKDIGTGTTDLLIRDLPNARDRKRMSDYSVAQELQADRVGLSLMAMAGYDPREAPVIWKNMFNKYGGNGNEKKPGKNYGDPLQQNGDLLDLGSAYLNNALKKKSDVLTEKSKVTHPDELKRFAELNRLIARYYSSPQAIAQVTTGSDRYKKIMTDFVEECMAEAKKMEAEAKAAEKKRAELDKQFAGAVRKKKEYLLNAKAILVYKGYSLKPIVNLAEFAKPACSSATITKEINATKPAYDNVNEKILEFIQEFKKGEVEPHEKDQTFAEYYLVCKGINELAVNFAASASICDAVNAKKYNPTNGELTDAVRRGYNSRELEEMVNYLKDKKE